MREGTEGECGLYHICYGGYGRVEDGAGLKVEGGDRGWDNGERCGDALREVLSVGVIYEGEAEVLQEWRGCRGEEGLEVRHAAAEFERCEGLQAAPQVRAIGGGDVSGQGAEVLELPNDSEDGCVHHELQSDVEVAQGRE